jgi:hypothetical protein
LIHRAVKFDQAREAAILLPRVLGGAAGIPEGAAVLAPLDEEGTMFSYEGRLIACVEDGSGYGTRLWDFLDMASTAALGIRFPGKYGAITPFPANEISIVAIYDLDRQVISTILQPSLLEDWSDEDRDDLHPPFAPSGTSNPVVTRHLLGSGKSLLHKDPGIIQLRNGQVLVQIGNGSHPVLFDHDDDKLVIQLKDHDLPSEVRRRIFGRPAST